MTDPNRKKLLIVITKAPYGSSSAQEALDVVLAAGTFDQDVSLLISADACYQLLPSQQPEVIQGKNTYKMLKALPIFGIENIYVDDNEALHRGINLEITTLPVQFINQSAIADLYQQADTVLRF